MTLTVTSATLQPADATNASSLARQALEAAIEAEVAAKLGRDPATVNVTDISLPEPAASGRRLSTNVAASVELLPYGGDNALSLVDLSDKLVTGAAAGDIVLANVVDVAVAAVCGNGVCESGERPDSVAGVQGCASVCA